MLWVIARSQLYADSRSRVPMKILNTLPEKIAFLEAFFFGLKSRQIIPMVACLILFGDNYTSFLRHGWMEFKKSV
jgi:hypothetical protein